ncbi:methionyl-tRNA formyltransferase [Candidatus Uhrbacteria bacterium]|nr:methionyl-tRNA formyltransferase [Candidatus Uhrbacteria bacterium]
MQKHRIIFMGTPDYAAQYLEGLISANCKPIAVITQPDRPAGRAQTIEPTPVKRLAEKNNITVYQPDDIRDDEWTEKIQELNPDLIIVVAFGQIIPLSILNIPPKGCINVHPSLLPRHRGATPWQEAILQGDTKTGVTIMLMDEKMDHGPILAQETFSLAGDETTESLAAKTADIGIPLLIKTVHIWTDGRGVPREQEHDRATYTRLLKKESGKIDWSKSAKEIYAMMRALNPWPGTWTEWRGRRIKILLAQPTQPSSRNAKKENIFFADGDRLLASCGNDEYLEINKLQVEGKNVVTGAAFIHGYLN